MKKIHLIIGIFMLWFITSGTAFAFNPALKSNPFGIVTYWDDWSVTDYAVRPSADIARSLNMGWMQGEGPDMKTESVSWGTLAKCCLTVDKEHTCIGEGEPDCSSFVFWEDPSNTPARNIHRWVTDSADKGLNILMTVSTGNNWNGNPLSSPWVSCSRGTTGRDCAPDGLHGYQQWYNFVFDIVVHFDGSHTWKDDRLTPAVEKKVPEILHFMSAPENWNEGFWGGTAAEHYGVSSEETMPEVEIVRKPGMSSPTIRLPGALLPVMWLAIQDANDSLGRIGDQRAKLVVGAAQHGGYNYSAVLEKARELLLCDASGCDPKKCKSIDSPAAMVDWANKFGFEANQYTANDVTNCQRVVNQILGKWGQDLFFEASLEFLRPNPDYTPHLQPGSPGFDPRPRLPYYDIYSVHSYGSNGAAYYDEMKYVRDRLTDTCQESLFPRECRDNPLPIWQTGAGIVLPFGLTEEMYAFYQIHLIVASFAVGFDSFTISYVDDLMIGPFDVGFQNGLYDIPYFKARHTLADSVALAARVFRHHLDIQPSGHGIIEPDSYPVGWRIYPFFYDTSIIPRSRSKGGFAVLGCTDTIWNNGAKMDFGDPKCTGQEDFSDEISLLGLQEADTWAVYTIDGNLDSTCLIPGFCAEPEVRLDGLDGRFIVWGSDFDNDLIPDIVDTCPQVANTDQIDNTNEYILGSGNYWKGQGPIKAPDGVGDACDNCIDITNPDQENADGDLFGDLCDNCPFHANDDQADSDNDGIGDACEPQIEIITETFDIDGPFSDYEDWTVVDDPDTKEGPSNWLVFDEELLQTSTIIGPNQLWSWYFRDKRKGTMAIYDGEQALPHNVDEFPFTLSNYELSATLMVSSTNNRKEDGIGVVFYYQDMLNYYKFEMDDLRNFRSLFKVVDGVEYLLDSVAADYPIGQDMSISIKVVDNFIFVSLDGMPVFENAIYDHSLDRGTFALYSWHNAGAHFDDVSIKLQPKEDKAY